MKFSTALILSFLFTACASRTPIVREPESDKKRPTYDMGQLQTELGMSREMRDLGFIQREFDSCRYNIKGDRSRCGSRHFNVIHFRMLCRDSEDTVSEVPSKLTPLQSPRMQWKVGAQAGIGTIDSEGYGQVKVVSEGPLIGQRLVLIVGKQFLGLEVSEVNQIVVPIYWCRQ